MSDSGRFMTLARAGVAVSTVENWSVDYSIVNSEEYVASNTFGGTNDGGGVIDWNGSFQQKTANPVSLPNDEFEVKGYTAPDDGNLGSVGTVYTGPVIVSQTQINWQYQNNGLITSNSTFAGKPDLKFPVEAPIQDLSIPTEEEACGTYISYYDPVAGAWVEIPDLASASLTLSSNLFETSNSSSRAGGQCFITRGPGPINWTATINQENHRHGIAGAPAIGSLYPFRFFTMAGEAEYWELTWGRVMSYTGLQVDGTSNTPINRTINIKMRTTNAGWPLALKRGYITTPKAPGVAWFGTYGDPTV